MADAWEKKRALATKVRRAVFARAGGRCELRYDGCTGTAEEVDHIIPRAAGGPMFDLTNLRAVCRNCHKQRPSAARFEPSRVSWRLGGLDFDVRTVASHLPSGLAAAGF